MEGLKPSKSIFGDYFPEFSAKVDVYRHDWQKKVEYPSVKGETEEMEGDL